MYSGGEKLVGVIGFHDVGVVKELREMYIFSQHNVIKDAPFSKLDLCRAAIFSREELQSVNEELTTDVRSVLRTLASVERELTATASCTRYIVRILPYRSIDNFIAGVVITFIDVTAITRAEERQRLLLAELQHRVQNTLGDWSRCALVSARAIALSKIVTRSGYWLLRTAR